VRLLSWCSVDEICWPVENTLKRRLGMPQIQSPQPRPRIVNTLKLADCVAVRWSSSCFLSFAEVLVPRSLQPYDVVGSSSAMRTVPHLFSFGAP
jgi:hypothetical protein